MIQRRTFVAALLALLFFSFHVIVDKAQAEYRIATVDINRIMNDSGDSKAMKTKLDQLSMKAKQEIDVEKKKLEDFQKKIQAKDGTASNADAEKYQKMAREFSRAVKDTEEDLKREFMKSNKTLTDKTLKIIESYAQKNQIDLVLDKSLKTRGPVLFGTPSVDITDDIIGELNS